jgi:PPM family protein phosphatase
MRFAVDAFTNAGPRSENQDAIGIKEFGATNLVAVVADGLGGHVGGKIAAELAVKSFLQLASENSVDLRVIAKEIHTQIRTYQSKNSEMRSMATTLSGAVFRGDLMEFVHCGDTRIAVARNAGIRKLTVDHTEAQRLLTAGAISEADFQNYPRKNVLESALGIKGEPRIDVGHFPLMQGDKFFFSTDGFHNIIQLRELFHFASRFGLPKDVTRVLKDEMIRRNAEDNYTLVSVLALG